MKKTSHFLRRQCEKEEENSAELSPDWEHSTAASNSGTSVGIIGFLTGIISLFCFPAVLGPFTILCGFMSFLQGRRALGFWTMLLGIISLLGYIMYKTYIQS
ncbi:hypothetical protein [Paenibacillus larvae]|uniref:hypothetical protein n=1 Tax=Paenibacillus larvae TaxID=1464 RepID=UPI0023A94B92|nr:hypothetical protein [Paenibacillus larvae]MDE5125678.1 hypothetical protein [Paenibacillus larvae subsp. larvae]